MRSGLNNDTCYQHNIAAHNSPVVVLIHGVGLNQSMWRDWIPVLADDFTVLTYDLYGHGGSSNPAGARVVEDFVVQLKNLLDLLGLKKIALVGFSIGAIIAGAFAFLHPQRISQLVFLHGVYQRTEQQCQPARQRYQITKQQGPMATVELAIKRWYSADFIQDNPARMDEIRAMFARHTDDGYLKSYHFFCHAEQQMQNYDMTEVDIPALVITGTAEVGATPAMAESLARDLPRAELIINRDHLHMAVDEHADILAGQVRSFLMQPEQHY